MKGRFCIGVKDIVFRNMMQKEVLAAPQRLWLSFVIGTSRKSIC